MKKLVLIAVFLFPNFNYAQIVINKFEYEDYSLKKIANNFEKKLSEKLKRSFHILEQDFEELNEQIAVTRIREYFQESISPKFEPATYVLSGKISASTYDKQSFNFNLELKNIKTRVVTASISEENLNEKDITEISENIYNFLKNTIPMYFKIISYLNNTEFTLNYGKDLSAEKGDELELVSLINNEVIGEVNVSVVYTESSSADYELFSTAYDFNNMTFRDYYVRTKIDPNKAEKYRDEISSFGLDLDRYLDQRNNWLIFSLQNFSFKSDSLNRFFNQKSLSPLIFGLQWNWSKDYTRFYLKGRASLSSSIQSKSSSDPNILFSESMVFWSAGAGIQHIFPVLDLLFPGLAFEVNYTQFHFKRSSKNINSSAIIDLNKETIYKGIDIELNGNILLKISSFGIYSDIAFHLFPYLQDSNKNDLSTSSFSGALGFCFYF